jgi:hypothetical protein
LSSSQPVKYIKSKLKSKSLWSMVCSCFVRFAHKDLLGSWGVGGMGRWLNGGMAAWMHGCMGAWSLVIVSDLLFYRFSFLSF